MKIKSIALLMAAAAALLSACGGGGSDAGVAGAGGGGGGIPAATAVSYGTITQFGSIWVNGVEFSTSNASFRVKGQPGAASDLRIGMVVRVDGSINDKAASLVTVVGVIAIGQTLIILTAGIDLSCGMIMALGSIVIDSITRNGYVIYAKCLNFKHRVNSRLRQF